MTHAWTRIDDRPAIVTPDEPATRAELDAAVDAARQELEDAYQACLRLKPAGEAFVPIRPGEHDPDADASPYGDARRRAAAAYLAAEAAIDRAARHPGPDYPDVHDARSADRGAGRADPPERPTRPVEPGSQGARCAFLIARTEGKSNG